MIFGVPGAGLAQNAPAMSDDAKAVVGAWELSNSDRDKICPLILGSDPSASGFKLDLDRNCASVFPMTKDIAAWAMDADGTLRFVDAAGRTVLDLTEVESGLYDGFRRDEGRYIMQITSAVPVHTADELVGEWAIARGTGKPICRMTLAKTASAADQFALTVKPGCDGFVRSFGPTSWRMDRGELILYSPRGQTWRFEENDANTWQRVPESPDPVLLVRQ
jgi:hypothetical protein